MCRFCMIWLHFLVLFDHRKTLQESHVSLTSHVSILIATPIGCSSSKVESLGHPFCGFQERLIATPRGLYLRSSRVSSIENARSDCPTRYSLDYRLPIHIKSLSGLFKENQNGRKACAGRKKIHNP